MKENSNSEISGIMKAMTFFVMLKYYLFKDESEGESHSDDLPNVPHSDSDLSDEAMLLDEESEEFQILLREAIAKQLPDKLKGNQAFAELIRQNFYELTDDDANEEVDNE